MRLLVLLCLVACQGCAASGTLRDASAVNSLAEVNAALWHAGAVSVLLDDGSVARDARRVVVSSEDVRFVQDGRAITVPVDRVEWVVTQQGRATGTGAAVGVVPGLLGVGILGVAVASGEAGSGANSAVEAAALVVGAAVCVAAVGVGALVGGLVGRFVPTGERVILYKAPVTQYEGGGAPPTGPSSTPR